MLFLNFPLNLFAKKASYAQLNLVLNVDYINNKTHPRESSYTFLNNISNTCFW